MAWQKKAVTVVWTAISLLVASCSPPSAPTLPTKTLPPPIIEVTYAAPGNDVPAFVPTETPLSPTPTRISKPQIARMADELFGARQIQSVSIPAIGVSGDIVPVGWRIDFDESYQSGDFEWDNPGADVGWVINSALPDETDNIVLYGHNNIYGRIFQNLYEVKAGDKVYLQTQGQIWTYETRYVMLLPILGADAEWIRNYRRYLEPTADARVTIISCYPPESNTHRVVVIATPVEK